MELATRTAIIGIVCGQHLHSIEENIMAIKQFRPNHTGTARVEALRQANRRQHTPKPPTHLLMKGAAVALDTPSPSAYSKPKLLITSSILDNATPARPKTLHAHTPLVLSGKRRALALRMTPGKIEVLVLSGTGDKQWHPAEKVLSDNQAKTWAKEGFK